MTGTDISLLGLAASGILIALAVGISLWRRLGIEGSVIWAATRALIQLLLVGAALGLVVNDDDPIMLSWLWIAVMIAVASWTVGRRVDAVPGVAWLAMAAFTAALVVTFGVLFGFGVFGVSGRTVVPLGGMIVGNSLAATVLVARRVADELRDHRALIEGRLALGLPASDAFAPHLRSSLRTALIPQIEITKAVGIIALPGAMVGLILAGTEPAEAVRVQVAVMYLVLGSVATTTTVMGLGLARRAFTSDHRIASRTVTPPTVPPE